MATPLEITERQKFHLNALLKLKRNNQGTEIVGLDELIQDAVAVMNKEDVAWVEKVAGIKAI